MAEAVCPLDADALSLDRMSGNADGAQGAR